MEFLRKYATKILTLLKDDSIIQLQSNRKNFVTISKWGKEIENRIERSDNICKAVISED